MPDPDVLVAGAGPVGLTMAAELLRHGVGCRVVDRLAEPTGWVKAVGVQPRTLEMWDDWGIAREAIDDGRWMRGQIVYVDGEEAQRVDLAVPDGTFGFLALPQDRVERLLLRRLERLGGRVERPRELRSFEQDADGVTAVLDDDRVRTGYLVGCDGAHSAVRRGLGLSFEGDAFPEEYMLGDVEIEWSQPEGYGVRFLAKAPDGSQDILVAIPLPGHRRYRISMLAAPELRSDTIAEHGIATETAGPSLEQLQAVVDRLVPGRPVVGNLRWSSVFRISHRIVDRYAVGRAFVCGDAAHIHPPTGAQGANTGMQDAYNLAWKLALAIRGLAAPGLLDSYDAERRPVGEEVVGRTVRQAREQSMTDAAGGLRAALMREGQLLIGYPDSPLVDGAGGAAGSGPAPGERAPDVDGLEREGVGFPVRLHELLRGPVHVALIHADAPLDEAAALEVERVARALADRCAGALRSYVIVRGDDPAATPVGVPVIRDRGGSFAVAYGLGAPAICVIRPDGYIASLTPSLDAGGPGGVLARTFA